MSAKLKIRFRDFLSQHSTLPLQTLISMVYMKELEVIFDPAPRVDVEITGPYGGDSDDFKTTFSKRLIRGALSKSTKGRHVTVPTLASGITPSRRANANVWYTGENQRPPFGNWDAYLSFDTQIAKDKNIYFPLWFLTSTDTVSSLSKSYWGSPFPTLEKLLDNRQMGKKKKKFACAFIGKTYRSRLHLFKEINKIGKLDIYGPGVRKRVHEPFLIARDYLFAVCFENDLYPGYVTEKPFEAYLSETIPIYFGIDAERYINSKSVLNLHDYHNVEDWLERIKFLYKHPDSYEELFALPLLKKKPNIKDIINRLRNLLPNV